MRFNSRIYDAANRAAENGVFLAVLSTLVFTVAGLESIPVQRCKRYLVSAGGELVESDSPYADGSLRGIRSEDDVQFGARPLKRAIQTYLEDGLSELIISSELQTGDTISVSLNEDKGELDIKKA